MIRFSKYHGCGNDFIIMTAEDASGWDGTCAELAERICHRQLGIGADGLIIVEKNPLEMIFYNSDGSRAPMCGNGIRCFAHYCFDEGICTDDSYPVMTQAGEMGVRIVDRNPFLVEIDMGKPDFDPKRCGIDTEQRSFLKQKLQLKCGSVEVSSCFMGTIHTVLWLEGQETDLEELGEEISVHPVFSEKTNVNFVRVLDRGTLSLTTYERGAGMTFACGTGACASVVIGALEGRCGRDAVVQLPYGELHIRQLKDDEVMMTGPAIRVASGFYDEE
jgi:diaminopimelate epimerase